MKLITNFIALENSKSLNSDNQVNAKIRIESIDLLKGLVMVIMALDHVRDYFHFSAFMFDPTDLEQTTIPIYFTRFITHFCAPAFSFLAGLSAFMISKRKSRSELSRFLLKRGLWLIFIELTIVSFAWHFDPSFTRTGLLVIWSLGVSMIVLAGLIHLPIKFILLFSLVLIFGHNLLDGIDIKDNIFWSILHQRNTHFIDETHYFGTAFALIPWVAVMSLGYCFGPLYNSTFNADRRKRILNGIGLGSIGLFIILSAFNFYGDPVKWTNYGLTIKTMMSILNVTKYPPSLLYLLITLGPSMLFLANTEKLKGKVVNFLSVFGRVPFFYYILHLYLIHLLAMFAAELSGFGWQSMILLKFVSRVEALKGFGFNLMVVYAIWILVILMLYPICRKFDQYKQTNKEKWWLSYL
ncbi:MAG TPA: heparan-alpha-glucosaminide N-acetyltransferase domain-containing protein [Saprospiraceae bacterium]|nr:heparan-alpha-glucosaminide N-acetyltransferase domain-containing protein [Saprospiraceae bacterium]HPN69014.1 heparan-alpha-glucosaminide N-acetyltransferase domain-containing protein [Saprospiraceae bacterium]